MHDNYVNNFYYQQRVPTAKQHKKKTKQQINNNTVVLLCCPPAKCLSKMYFVCGMQHIDMLYTRVVRNANFFGT